MKTFYYISLFICLIIISYLFWKRIKVKQVNNEIIKQNEKNEQQHHYLKNLIIQQKERLEDLRQEEKRQKEILNDIRKNWETALINYSDTLDDKYKDKENEYDNDIQTLNKAFEQRHEELLKEVEEQYTELNKIKATRNAAIAAQLQEKKIKEERQFYCLSVSTLDKEDIKTLNQIKETLHQPRILCMLIWSTFFQKPMTALCNNILGTTIKSGIYKITNLKTNECYIGQAVDIAKRWKDHAKCGLGIDTPINNKLYSSMQEDGIWNFSWELLEECPKEQLNEKEKFYIDLYDSKNFGFNTINGIQKK